MRRLLIVSLLTALLGGIATAQEPPAIAKHGRWVTDLAFSGDCSVLATVGGESARLLCGTAFREVHVAQFRDSQRRPHFLLRCGRVFAACSKAKDPLGLDASLIRRPGRAM